MSRPRKRIFVSKKIWLFPHGIEREYKSLMLTVVDACKNAVASNEALIEAIIRSSPFKKDAEEDGNNAEKYIALSALFNEILAGGISETKSSRLISELSTRLQNSFRLRVDPLKMEREILKITSRVNEFNSKQFRSVLRSALQVDVFQHEPELNDLLSVWAQENVRLIKTIPSQYFGDVERITSEGFKSGALTRDIANQIEEVSRVSQRRAFFIARDQMGSLNGDLTKYRQVKAGIDSYVWHTAGDSRVRPAHADRNGITYRWDDPPSGGHPGQDRACRCVALPVIDLDKINVAGVPIRR